MSDWPQSIYAAEGPIWHDEAGEEQCGWPHDGWSVELTQTGAVDYRILEQSRHIDGDGLRSDERLVDAEAAALWLADRVRKDDRAFQALTLNFEAQLSAAPVERESNEGIVRRLGRVVFSDRAGSFTLLDGLLS